MIFPSHGIHQNPNQNPSKSQKSNTHLTKGYFGFPFHANKWGIFYVTTFIDIFPPSDFHL